MASLQNIADSEDKQDRLMAVSPPAATHGGRYSFLGSTNKKMIA